jgi:transcriptional regulator with XRE-family HTH domain
MQRTMTDEIRHAVRVAMADKKLTQGELAKRAGITPVHLSRMMQGDRSNVPEAWQKVFDELGLELTVKNRGER